MLNKRGWGFRQMLLMMSILFIFLMIMVYYIVALYKSIDSNEFSNYVKMENNLAFAARDYINDTHSNSTVIKLKILKNHDYIDDFTDDNNNDCNGYVLYENGVYVPYISCKDYETDDYNENYE